MKTLIVNGHRWEFCGKIKEKFEEWVSDWLCSDGDCISFYIDKKDDADRTSSGGFTLKCFSGIPASEFHVDEVDFGHIIFQKNFPPEIRKTFWEKDYTERCLILADYFCEKFCEYKEVQDKNEEEGEKYV